WQWRTFVFVDPVVMFNHLSTCQPAFPHQSSCQPPACMTNGVSSRSLLIYIHGGLPVQPSH
ncbi:hypothetical protein ACJ6U6_25170, partial [Escherichia coli]